jgi:integrase
VRTFDAALAQDQRLTVGEIVTAYIADRRKEGKAADKLGHQWKPLAPHFEALQPVDLATPYAVEGQDRTRCHAYAVNRQDQGKARDTIHSELSMLRTAMSWATKRGMIPPVHVWVPSAGKPRENALTEDQILQLIGAILEAPTHIRLLMLLAWTTGARRQAILDLTWDRINIDARTIDYNTHVEKSILDTSHQKGRSISYMGEGLRRELIAAKAIAKTDHVIEWRGKPVKDPREGVKAVFDAAGIVGRYIGLHALRRTLATSARDHGIDLKAIQEQLGHADMKTTEGVYIQARAHRLKDVAALGDRLTQRVIDGDAG